MSALNLSIFRLINNLSGSSETLDFLMIILSSANFWFAIAGVAVLLSIKKFPRLRKPLFQCLLSIGLSDSISFEVVKPLVKHERPCWTREHTKTPLGYCGGSYGFTSNHAANAGAAAGVLSFAYPKLKFIAPIWFVALSVGISRIYLGVHEPVDIIGGLILGFLISALVCFLTKKLPPKLISRD